MLQPAEEEPPAASISPAPDAVDSRLKPSASYECSGVSLEFPPLSLPSGQFRSPEHFAEDRVRKKTNTDSGGPGFSGEGDFQKK